MYFIPVDIEAGSKKYEELYFNLVTNISKEVLIPIAVKLGQNFTNLPYLVKNISYRGAKAVVLFNRYYSPDIDIEKNRIISSDVLSHPSDLRYSLRWTGIVSALVENIDICASTGIHTPESVIKQVLAGAKAVQVCSAVYKKGIGYLHEITEVLEKWMKNKNYKSVEDFRGKLNYKTIHNPALFERSQFMKYFSDMT